MLTLTNMNIYRLITIISLLLIVPLLLSACKIETPMLISTNVQSLYNAPNTYQDHRDQQQTLDIDGVKIAYTDHGKGPTIVLLHGVPTSSWMYRKVIPELQKNMRVISIDFLGFGSSDKPLNGNNIYSPSTRAQRVSTLLSHLNVSEYALLFHDMGGLVAWELMRKSPQNISHAIVLNTIVSRHGFYPPKIKPGIMTRQLMSAYSSELTSTALLEKTFNDLGLVNEHELNEDECFGYVAPMREGSDEALYAFFTSLNEELFRQLDQNQTQLSIFTGETLVLWGAGDEILTTKQIPILQKTLNIDPENIHIYPDHNHFLAEEMPKEIVLKINKFVL